MAERGRPPFAYQRGPRFGFPRPNVPNAPIARRPLLVTPPAVPSRFPPLRGIEPRYGAFHEDPRQFPQNAFNRGPPPSPRTGMDLARPRFPCPRVQHPPAHMSSGHPPRAEYPGQPPPIHAQPREKLRPMSQPPGPGFRANRPLRFPPEDRVRTPFLRGDLPRPGFNRGEFPPRCIRPEEGYAHPRPKFAPPDAVPRGPLPPHDRAFRFPCPPMGQRPFQDRVSMEEVEMNGGSFRARPYHDENCQVTSHEQQDGGWDYHPQDWPRWQEVDGGTDPNWSGHDAPMMTEGSHQLERTSEMEPSRFGSGGDVKPQPRIRFIGRNRPIEPSPRQADGWQPAKTRAEQSEGMARDNRPSENEPGGSRESYGWTEPEPAGPRDPDFTHPDPGYFEPSSGQDFRDMESPGAGGQSGLRRDRRPYEQQQGNETETRARRDVRPLKRSSSHLTESPPTLKRERLTTARSQDFRSHTGRDRSRTGSTRDREFVERSGSGEPGSPRHRRLLNSGSAARGTNRDSLDERRSTEERNDNRSRRLSDPVARKYRSRSSREDADDDKKSVPSRRRSDSRGSPRRRTETRSTSGHRSSSGHRRSHHHKPMESESLDNSETGSRPRSRLASRHSRQLSPSPVNQSKANSSSFEKKALSNEAGITILPPAENKVQEVEEEERVPDWIRCSPADLYFKRDRVTGILVSTNRMQELEKKVEYELLCRAERVKENRPPVELPPRNASDIDYQLSDEDSLSNLSLSEIEDMVEGDEEEEGENKKNKKEELANTIWMEELNWKQNHPERLHDEMWFNLPGEMNDGPLCRCSAKSKGQGIRHNIYPGEEPTPVCDPSTNNQDKLFHYRVTMSPHTNFLTKNPTLVEYDSHEYIFEGFSLFSHYRIGKIPLCKVIRFNIEYTIHWFEEEMIENFDIKGLDLFADFLYREILELIDLDWAGKPDVDKCRPFHIMPRFARDLPDNGKEILSMNEVLNFLLRSSRPLLEETELANMLTLDENEWQNVVDEVRGMIVTYPGMRPSSLRIDQLDREQKDPNVITYPKIIHFGLRPAQLSYAGDPKYKKLWKHYLKLKHLIANKPKASVNDREKMRVIEDQLQEIRLKGSMKREMTVEISSEGFIRTGIKSDICQHALLLPVLIQHLRFHRCLDVLEKNIKYQFKDRLYLELAMTHPSYRTNYGTNPDHARNSLTNCGFRQLEYGDRQIHYIHRRKRGINVLMHIMSKLAKDCETPSEIHHYERLEFLGDSVIEFLSSIHLFFMFPRLEEGGLATYRAALVQNQFLTVLAEKIGLHHFMLYAHGPDLCRDLDLRYAMANCFEALMGSLFLDGGVEEVDKVYSDALFKDEPDLLHVWINLPRHPLQEDEPNGDRHWIDLSPPLQKLTQFEKMTGIIFNHIRLLARAFTMRNIGYNNLTLGHNQTLEFLGDTILQFISSEYLFKHFPDHHEGHLTLLRTSLVNHRTQATICDDLGMTEYVINNDQKVRERMENEKNKVKDKADILEAFLGALYVDQGLESCKVLTEVCFYPRLREFIMNQDWNDAKSQLQQCCLTLRDPSDGDPDIPIYKVLQCTGPTNTRKYHVAVYFRGERLGTGIGHSIQRAEMNAAANALKEKQDMFPHLLHVQHFLERRFGKRRKKMRDQPKANPHHRRHHDASSHVARPPPPVHHQRRLNRRSPPSQKSSERHNRRRSAEKSNLSK